MRTPQPLPDLSAWLVQIQWICVCRAHIYGSQAKMERISYFLRRSVKFILISYFGGYSHPSLLVMGQLKTLQELFLFSLLSAWMKTWPHIMLLYLVPQIPRHRCFGDSYRDRVGKSIWISLPCCWQTAVLCCLPRSWSSPSMSKWCTLFYTTFSYKFESTLLSFVPNPNKI